MKMSKLPEALTETIEEYTRLRNAEGVYINETLKEIQNVIIWNMKQSNIDADFVDACKSLPLALTRSPCFQSDLIKTENRPRSKVLDRLKISNLDENNKMILMAVVDIGAKAKEPVVWLSDGNLCLLEDVHERLNTTTARTYAPKADELLYKKVELNILGAPFTSKEDFNKKHKEFIEAAKAKIAPNETFVGSLKQTSVKLREIFMRYNQSSIIGVMQFIDIMGKMGSVLPCLQMIDFTGSPTLSLRGAVMQQIINKSEIADTKAHGFT